MIEKGHWVLIFLAIITIAATLVEGEFIAMFILCAFIWHEVGWGILFVMAIVFWPLLCFLIIKRKEVLNVHPALLNGHPKCTLIESFKGEVFVIRPGFRKDCENLKGAQEFIVEQGWVVNIEIIKGDPIGRRLQDEKENH